MKFALPAALELAAYLISLPIRNSMDCLLLSAAFDHDHLRRCSELRSSVINVVLSSGFVHLLITLHLVVS